MPTSPRARRPQCLLHIAALALAVAAPAALASPAAETVTAFHGSLHAAMADGPKLLCEGRMQSLQPAVDATFDLPFLAERALRRHWKTLDAAQRSAFAAALRRSVITTYATEFAEPGAAAFATGRTEALANGDALVRSTLTPRGGGSISLDYVMRQRGERWQVVNVLAEGVSDLALRATQYDGLIKAQGFDALMTRLDAQTEQLRARCK